LITKPSVATCTGQEKFLQIRHGKGELYNILYLIPEK
jgi:hypothetical protein